MFFLPKHFVKAHFGIIFLVFAWFLGKLTIVPPSPPCLCHFTCKQKVVLIPENKNQTYICIKNRHLKNVLCFCSIKQHEKSFLFLKIDYCTLRYFQGN